MTYFSGPRPANHSQGICQRKLALFERSLSSIQLIVELGNYSLIRVWRVCEQKIAAQRYSCKRL